MSARISALLLLALLALSRWPGLLPPNFSPVYALAFCSGVYLPGRLARNTLLSGGLFTGLFVGAQRLSERMGERETEEGEEAPQTGSEAEPSQA
jgi:hypothetical protein